MSLLNIETLDYFNQGRKLTSKDGRMDVCHFRTEFCAHLSDPT
jgi:hypothetical protein